VGVALVPGDMIFGDDTAPLVNEDPAFDVQHIHFVLQHAGINKDAAANAELCFLIDKTGRDHPDSIFFGPDLNSVAGIGANPTPGDDYRLVLMGDMGNNLALAFISKKSTYDDCTAHCISCSIGGVPK